MNLIIFLIIGLVAGLLARAIFPGKQAMGLVGTLVLGALGSFVGGAIGSMAVRGGSLVDFTPAGLVWSTVGALVVLAIAQLVGRRRGV